MTKITSRVRGIRDDEQPSQGVVDWAAKKYPAVDVVDTFEVFADHCKAQGSMYACFDAALRTWIRNAVDKGYGGVVYKTGRAADPKWIPVLAEAKDVGFRAPLPHEQPGSFRSEMDTWLRTVKRSTVTTFPLPADALKKFG